MTVNVYMNQKETPMYTDTDFHGLQPLRFTGNIKNIKNKDEEYEAL